MYSSGPCPPPDWRFSGRHSSFSLGGSRSTLRYVLPPSSPPLATSTLPSSDPGRTAPPRGVIMIANRPELVRSAHIGVLSVGLSPSDGVDRPWLERQAPLSACFTEASADLWTHTLCNRTVLIACRAPRRGALCARWSNRDLRLIWVNELIRFALRGQPPAVPPPPDTVFAIPPVPATSRTFTFCGGGEEILKTVEETARGNHAAPAGRGLPRKRKAAAGPSSSVAGHTRKKTSQPCNMFVAAAGRCKWWRDCV